MQQYTRHIQVTLGVGTLICWGLIIAAIRKMRKNRKKRSDLQKEQINNIITKA